MPRLAKENDFTIDLPTVGRFRFGRETLGDHIAIQAAYVALSSGQEGQNNYLDFLTDMAAHYQVLCVSAPDGWGNLAAMDYTEATVKNLAVLYKELMERLKSFRSGTAQAGPVAGVSGSADISQLVPADV